MNQFTHVARRLVAGAVVASFAPADVKARITAEIEAYAAR